MSVWEMKPGESREVKEITDPEIVTKLLEMGCLPGTTIVYNYKAPLGEPICITVNGYDLLLRKKEAKAIKVN